MSKLASGPAAAAVGVAFWGAGVGLVVAAGPGAVGATPTTLNPAPPDSYVCAAVGSGTRCVSDTSVVLDPEPSGILCGSGAEAFEVADQATRQVRAERWYDANGDMVKRVRANDFSDSWLSNPSTGAAVGYNQHDVDTEILAVPGDVATATTTSVESFVAVAPGYGSVLVNTGRSVYAPDGSVLSRTGRRDFDAYFGGDESVMAPLCAALSE
jgi:hypothetical protein